MEKMEHRVSQVVQEFLDLLVRKGRPARRERGESVVPKALLALQVLRARVAQRGGLARLEIEDLWDLLEQMDKMELLDPKEFQALRGSLVKLDLKVLPGGTDTQ